MKKIKYRILLAFILLASTILNGQIKIVAAKTVIAEKNKVILTRKVTTTFLTTQQKLANIKNFASNKPLPKVLSDGVITGSSISFSPQDMGKAGVFKVDNGIYFMQPYVVQHDRAAFNGSGSVNINLNRSADEAGLYIFECTLDVSAYDDNNIQISVINAALNNQPLSQQYAFKNVVNNKLLCMVQIPVGFNLITIDTEKQQSMWSFYNVQITKVNY